MNVCLECLPCLGKNAVDAAKRSTNDPEIQKAVVSAALKLLAETDFFMPPPCIARKILDIALKYTGAADIYAAEKKRSNALAEQLVAELPRIREYDPEDFGSRLRLAVAGNILDFGIFGDLDIARAMEVVKSAFAKPLDKDAVKKLQRKMDEAEKILYILDNCGEAVFDRVFMEPYRHKITLGVRGRAAFNDVTADDLEDCGLAGFTGAVVSNGPSGIPGTVLSEVSPEFMAAYSASDLILAKGQGNFETMNGYQDPIAFLFLAKCPVVTRTIGAAVNSVQIILNF